MTEPPSVQSFVASVASTIFFLGVAGSEMLEASPDRLKVAALLIGAAVSALATWPVKIGKTTVATKVVVIGLGLVGAALSFGPFATSWRFAGVSTMAVMLMWGIYQRLFRRADE